MGQIAKVSSNTATMFTFLNLSRIREHYKKLLCLYYNNVSLKGHLCIVTVLFRDIKGYLWILSKAIT